MCEGIAYLLREDNKERLMDEVAYLEVKEDELILINEDGIRRVLDRFKEIRVDMIKHEIIVVP